MNHLFCGHLNKLILQYNQWMENQFSKLFSFPSYGYTKRINDEMGGKSTKEKIYLWFTHLNKDWCTYYNIIWKTVQMKGLYIEKFNTTLFVHICVELLQANQLHYTISLSKLKSTDLYNFIVSKRKIPWRRVLHVS